MKIVMRRTLSLILVVAMMLSVIVIPATAATEQKIWVESVPEDQAVTVSMDDTTRLCLPIWISGNAEEPVYTIMMKVDLPDGWTFKETDDDEETLTSFTKTKADAKKKDKDGNPDVQSIFRTSYEEDGETYYEDGAQVLIIGDATTGDVGMMMLNGVQGDGRLIWMDILIPAGEYDGAHTIGLEVSEVQRLKKGTENDFYAVSFKAEGATVYTTGGKQPADLPAITLDGPLNAEGVYEYVYTGEKITPVATIKDGETVVDSKYYTLTNKGATVVGSYQVKAVGSGIYKGESVANWAIVPADLTNVTDNQTMNVYNSGNAYDLPEFEATTLGTGNTVSVVYELAEGSDAYVTLADNKLTYKADGTATVNVTISAPNHNSVTRTVTVIVQNKNNVSGNMQFAAKKTEETYTGTAMPLSDFVNAATYNNASSSNISYLLNGEAATLESTITNAGTYTVTAVYEDAENKGTKEIVITIKKAQIDVSGYTWNYSAAFEYNKAAHTVALSSFDSKLDITYGGTYTATDAGKYNATASAAVKADYAANYEVSGTIAGCDWEITEKVVDLSDITTYTESFLYDGKAKNVEYQNIPEGVSVAYKGDLDKVNVGEYTTTATFTALTNYKLSGSNPKYMHWSITKADGKSLTAVWNPSYTDKSEKTLDFTTLLSDADIDLDNTSYTVSGVDSILKVTEIKNDEGKVTGITYALNNVTEANVDDVAVITVTFNSNNYAESTYTVTVTVKEKQPIDESTLTVVESTTEVYTGAEFNAENLDLVTSSAAPDGQWVETYVFTDEDGNRAPYAKNVGKYSVEVTLEDDSTTVTKTVAFEITPAELSVAGATVTEREYNAETAAEITAVSFTGLKGGDALTMGADYTVSEATFADADAEEDKTVTFTVTLTDAVKNYTLKSGAGEATGTITPKTVTAEVADVADQTYTGAQFKPEPAVTIIGALGEDEVGYTYTYGENVNVGEGNVTVEVASSNYTFVAVKKTFTIKAASLKTAVVSGEVKTTYGDDLVDEINESLEVTFNGNEVEGEWEVVGEVPTDAGEYKVAVKFTSESENFTGIIETTITVVINPAELNYTTESEKITSSGKTIEDYALVVTATGVNGEAVEGTITWYDEDGNVVDPSDKIEDGEKYTWVFTPNNDNYASVSESVVLYKAPVIDNTDADLVPGSAEHGSVTVNPYDPEEGDKVVVTVKPEKGYEVDEVIVTDEDGNPVKVVEAGDGKYIFVMPEGEVDIQVTYKKAETVKFLDVPETAWYHDAVYEAVDMGLFNGVSDKYFQPDGSMTRAMLVTVLWRLEGEPAAGSSDFADVADGSWYDEAVAWANEEGIVKGMSETEFAPNMAITREQMATMLYRYAKYLGLSTAGKADLSVYTDADKVSDWAEDAMAWAVAKGLITGTTETTLAPAATATRAQVATILVRFVKKFSL